MKIRTEFHYFNTHAAVLCDSKNTEKVIDGMKAGYNEIRSYGQSENNFLTSFIPVDLARDASGLIRKMNGAAQLFNVGPMAGVAGAVNFSGFNSLLEETECIIDNGGDIFAYSKEEINIGIWSGNNDFSGFGIKLPAKKRIAVCSSSGTFGHSISLGFADLATVISSCPITADCAATALCNSVGKKEYSDTGLLKDCFSILEGCESIISAFIICKDKIVTYGDIPEFTRCCGHEGLITRG